MEPSDEEVVTRVLRGEAQEYGRLVRKYERIIYNLMYRFTGSEMESADLTQDIFLQSYTKLRSLKSDKKYFSWLYAVAMNKGRDWVKKRNILTRSKIELHEAGSLTDRFSTSSQPEDEVQDRQESVLLEKALLALPPEKREPLILRYRYERPISEIAEILTISESAVKMRIKRSLEQLNSLLKKDISL